MDQLLWSKIKSTLEFALENRHSSFYRGKYAPPSLDKPEFFRSAEDFFRLPFLTKEELLKTPPFERLFTNPKSVGWAISTSGTSGKEPLITFRQENTESFLKYLPKTGKTLRCALVLCLPQNSVGMYRSFSGKIPVFFGNPHQLKETAAIASRLDIDMIYTAPDILLNFIEAIKSCYDLKKIRLLRFFGSSLSNSHKKIFHQEFPDALLVQGYSLNEVSRAAFQCESLARKELPIFHVHEDRLFFEIIPEKDGVGEIVLTHLKPEPSLLIRYQTGDLGEFIDGKCECGLNFPLIKIVGRKNLDKIKLNGIEFHISSFDDVIKNLRSYIETSFTAHFYQKIINDKIVGEIVVELTPRPHVKMTPILHTHIEETFNRGLHISNRFSFKDLIAQGLFLPIRVNFQEKNSAPPHKEVPSKRLIPHFDE